MLMRKRRLSARARLFACLLVALLGVGVSVIMLRHIPQEQIPWAHERSNFLIAHGPAWLAKHPKLFWPDHPEWGKAERIPELQAATWPGDFPTPRLHRPYLPDPSKEANAQPALLMLHVFSMATKASRERRDLIRRHSPLLSIPPEYRCLVELKFILGQRKAVGGGPPMSAEQAADLEEEDGRTLEEEAEFGDLVRLDGLVNGENMNQGKTLAWARWVGRDGGREAQWVMKCDDDTLPILPNLLPLLLELDPSVPTYVGSALPRWPGYAYYFVGMMYGFNWGVIRTLATADLGQDILGRHWDEDAYTGMLMYNLPSRPGLSETDAERLWEQDLSNGGMSVPVSPDPRTGLVRVDVGRRAGAPDRWWTAGALDAVALHPLKSNDSWLRALEQVTAAFQQAGREYTWSPPQAFDHLAVRDDAAVQDVTTVL